MVGPVSDAHDKEAVKETNETVNQASNGARASELLDHKHVPQTHEKQHPTGQSHGEREAAQTRIRLLSLHFPLVQYKAHRVMSQCVAGDGLVSPSPHFFAPEDS